MVNIFLEKSYTKCDGGASSRPFSEKLKLTISLGQWCKVLYSLFYSMASWGLLKYIETKLQIACFHLILIFLKNKMNSATSLPASFSTQFLKKNTSLLHSINWPNLIDWLSLLWEIFGNMCIATVFKPGCDVMNFEVKFIFLIKPFFLDDQKVMTKT